MPEEDERPQHEVIRFKTPTITSLKPFQHAKGRRRSQTTQGGGSPTGRRSPGKTRAPNPQSPERWSRAPSSGWRPVSEEDGYEVRVRVDEIGQYIFDKEESEEFKSALQKLVRAATIHLHHFPLTTHVWIRSWISGMHRQVRMRRASPSRRAGPLSTFC